MLEGHPIEVSPLDGPATSKLLPADSLHLLFLLTVLFMNLMVQPVGCQEASCHQKHTCICRMGMYESCVPASTVDSMWSRALTDLCAVWQSHLCCVCSHHKQWRWALIESMISEWSCSAGEEEIFTSTRISCTHVIYMINQSRAIPQA